MDETTEGRAEADELRLPLAEHFERLVAALPATEGFAPLEIVLHGARRIGGTTELSITLDRPGGVDLALSERVARTINAAFAERPEPYTLLVASAGLERPLVKPEDYERFRDRRVKIVTTVAIENRKTHRGLLRGLVEGAAVVTLDETGRDVAVPLESVRTANLEYDPRADLTRDKRERRDGDKNR